MSAIKPIASAAPSGTSYMTYSAAYRRPMQGGNPK
jgi:hypothetical protein